MMHLKDFEKDIEKCSKCGLCQAVCPIYKETGNECAVSKGKFVMLQGVLKGDLKLNKNINKYLDMCLKCGKCKEFCPSGIDVCKIFENAKYEYIKNTILGKIIFFLQSKFIFDNVINLAAKVSGSLSENYSNSSIKLLYFKGCVGKIFPKTSKLLKNLEDINIIEPDFDCCGIPFLSSGNLERFDEVKKHNLRIINNTEFDYIFTDCASCESVLMDYFENNKSVQFINLGELLVKLGIKFRYKMPVKVTFHKPCHLKNTDFLKPLFDNIENIEYIEHAGFDDCCGFAGEFALKNRQISKSISEKKAKNIINCGADYVITTCPSCILGLKQGLGKFKSNIKVITLSDFLSDCEIVK